MPPEPADEKRLMGPAASEPEDERDAVPGDADHEIGGSGTAEGPTRGAQADDALQEGLDRLQRAAKDTITAVRAVLDVAEDLVEDPRAVGTVLGTVGSLAEAVLRGARRPSPGRSDGAGTPDDGDDEGGFQRIPVS